jgi:hypothetical protein
MQNGMNISGKTTLGSSESCFWPRNNPDNGTYLRYGSGGFIIQNNSAIQVYSIDTNGNVSIGTASTSIYKLDVSGNIRSTGQITAASFNAGSDYRIKSNIRSLDDSTNVDKLKPVIYYNTQLKKEDIGFIAHELQEEFPFLVNGEKDGKEYQNINYNGIIGILVKEVQELKKQVKELQEKVHKLENT